MVSKTKLDLPPGWKVVVKKKSSRKFKCYVNSKNHKKFYSKAAALRYINGCSSNEKFQPVIEEAKKSSGKKKMHLVEANEYEWLPAGWILERRTRKSGAKAGNEYKCYIDPSTGNKFFSKPEVLRYLKSKECGPGSSRPKDRGGSGKSYSKRPVDPPSVLKSNLEPNVLPLSRTHLWKNLSLGKLKVVIERTVDQELPSGWIKETRIKQLRNKVVRRDSSFHDPASTLVFRSKMEVLRYVETGEVSRHAYRRKTGSIIGKDYAVENTLTTSSEKKEEIPKRTRKQLSVGEANSTSQSIQELHEAQDNKNAGGYKSTRSSSRFRSASVDSSPMQSNLSSKSTNYSQDMVVKKQLPEEASRTKETAGTRKKSEHSALSRGRLSRENPVVAAVKRCSNGEAQLSKRNTRYEKSPSVPCRSSKRLAGVDAEVVCHSTSIEHACRALIRKSSGTESVPSDLQEKHQIVDNLQEKHEIVDMKGWNESAIQATCRKTSRTKPVPSLVAAAVQRCSNEKAQASKRKTRHEKLSSKPSRSSKRLAGAETVFHQIPIDHACRATKSKSPGTKFIPSLVSAPNEFQEKHQTDHTKDWNESTLRATYTQIPSLASAPSDLQEKFSDVDTEDVLAIQEEKKCTPDFDPEIVFGTQGQPSNKIDDFTSQEENCQTLDFDIDIAVTSEETKHCLLDVDNENVFATLGEPLVKLNDLTSPEDIYCTLVDRENVFATRAEPSNRIDDLRREETKNPILNGETIFPILGEPLDKLDDLTSEEEKHCTLDVNGETLLVTQGEPSNKIDILATKKPILVDLNLLQLEQAPPGFSKDSEVKVSSSTIKQSSEYPINTSFGSKVENTSRVRPIVEERPGSSQRETEQPQSEFCFSSPLWSDPCLEFAYKTLTGAIPFDDNLAIQDYIQHQLRTTEENKKNLPVSDICAPSNLKYNEATAVSQLPGDANFSNSYGFGSPEIKHVKKNQ